jgi:hypothetical protein
MTKQKKKGSILNGICKDQKRRIDLYEKLLTGSAMFLYAEFNYAMERGEIEKGKALSELCVEIVNALSPDTTAVEFFSEETHEPEVEPAAS